MNKVVVLILALLAPIDGGEVNLETPEITKEDVQAYRKARFLQTADKMQEQLTPNLKCHSLFNMEQEIALWECEDSNDGRRYGALFVWQNENWAKTPGILKD